MPLGFTREELKIMRPYNSPRKIQDFLDTLEMNFEIRKETCHSPRRVLKDRKAHCIEGAMLAAAMLRIAGWKPLVMDLKATSYDFDHVVAVFQIDKCWGAISKTNHGVLRYREPIYQTIRELALSYFHEYFMDDGEKTLRSYSDPVDLSQFDDQNWMTTDDHLWYISKYIDSVPHHPILTRAQIARLRKANAIERKMGEFIEWPHPRTKKR